MRTFFVRALTIYLIVCLLCGIVLAAGEIYVNDANSKLSGNLSEAYAAGTSGTVQLGEGTVYAMTAAGVKPIIDDSQQTAEVPEAVIRVGLFYGSNTKPEMTLNLTNGSAFQAGYYDTGRTFVPLAVINESRVNIVPDRNAEIEDGSTGAFHVRLSAAFETMDDAVREAGKIGGFPAWLNGKPAVLFGSYPTRADAETVISDRGWNAVVFSGSNRSVSVLRAKSEKVLFLFDCGSTYSLSLSPVCSEKAVTQCGTNSYYGDFQFTRLTGENLTVVNVIGLEDYTKGVLPNEMASDWPLEALKAQAVVARTYAVANLNKFRSYGFDLSNDTSSQVYRGLNSASDKTNRAVDETVGKFVRYQGELCTVYYFAADGGATEDSENVWTETAVPYLRAVRDPYESDIEFYCKSWKYTVSKDDVHDVAVTYTPIGNAMTVTADGNTYSRDNVRTFLKNVGVTYTSRHFTIAETEDSYVIQGGGYGHNLGMSQWGAYSMADRHHMTFDQIISFYFTGATVG